MGSLDIPYSTLDDETVSSDPSATRDHYGHVKIRTPIDYDTVQQQDIHGLKPSEDGSGWHSDATLSTPSSALPSPAHKAVVFQGDGFHDTSHQALDDEKVDQVGGHPNVASDTSDASRDVSEVEKILGPDTGRSSSPSIPAEDQESLQSLLFRSLVKIPGHKERKGFFPKHELQDLMTKENVTKELQQCFEYLDTTTIATFAERISGSRKSLDESGKPTSFQRIFAILVLCEMPKAILKFLEAGVSDNDLPLQQSYSSNKTCVLTRKNKTESLKCFRGWSEAALWRFEEWQWTTLAPFFKRGCREDIKHLEFDDQIVLPYTLDGRFPNDKAPYQRLEFDGGFSNVFKVCIHKDHHDLWSFDARDPEAGFAIKCLLSKDRNEFDREVDTLVKFSGDAHKHLVSLLATYEQFGKFYLVFPWAESDLQNFWMNNNPELNHEAVLWLAEQCKGIADGLLAIHHYETSPGVIKRRTDSMINDLSLQKRLPQQSRLAKTELPKVNLPQLFGRHGDIKPENVLWYRDSTNPNDRGVFKISDFGLTEFSTAHAQCYKRNTQVAHSPSYRPPECDLQGELVGQSYDIWTLGCLYLELITWQLGGATLLDEFREKRKMHDPMRFMATDTFFEIVECLDRSQDTSTIGAMVKPAVLDFILHLHAHPACTDYFHEFLDFIRDEMLVVKSPNLGEKGRTSIREVKTKLSTMVKRCTQQCDYASVPTSWPRKNGDSEKLEAAVEVEIADDPANTLQWTKLRLHSGHTLYKVEGLRHGLL